MTRPALWAAAVLLASAPRAGALEFAVAADSFTLANQVNASSVVYIGARAGPPTAPATATQMTTPGGLYFDGANYRVWEPALSQWVAVSTGGPDASRVAKAGDAMTGPLTLAGSTLTVTGNAFSVRGSTFVVAVGSVGIGTLTPLSALHVNGQIRHALGIVSEGPGLNGVIGDARGLGAVDLQVERSAATQVAAGAYSVIAGGQRNSATASYATASGGFGNSASMYATVSGGSQNTASGLVATVPGGYLNTASGDYSFAAGYLAQATAQGSFVWADSQGVALANAAKDRFLARAQGGFQVDSSSVNFVNGAASRLYVDVSGNVGVGTAAPGAALHVLSPSGAGAANAVIIATGSLASQQIVTVSTSGVVTAAGGFTYGGDVAELYPSEEALEPGDVVALGGERLVRAARGRAEETVIGVVSTKPGLTIGLKDLPKSGRLVAVALLGRVPVKFSLENGPVAPGEPLGASATRAGWAHKARGGEAGVAVAFESCAQDGAKVLAFVRPRPAARNEEIDRLRREMRELRELVESARR